MGAPFAAALGDGPSDPPGCVGGESKALVFVEPLDGDQEALFTESEALAQREEAGIPTGDDHNETAVRAHDLITSLGIPVPRR